MFQTSIFHLILDASVILIIGVKTYAANKQTFLQK